MEDVFLKINNKAILNDMKYIKRNITYKKSKKKKIKEDNLNDKENSNLLENKIKSKIEINNKTSNFCKQLCASIVRGFYPLSRNKILFLLEILSGLGFVYIFIFFFSDFIINATKKRLNLLDVLSENDIFFLEEKLLPNFLKNFYAFNARDNKINLIKIKEKPNDIIHFMNISYDQAFVNLAKSGIYIDGSNEKLLNVYNTEIDTNLNGYLYANTMLFVSSFLKNYYNIDAMILYEIEMNFLSDNGTAEKLFNFLNDFIFLIILVLFSLFVFVIFLFFLLFEYIL